MSKINIGSLDKELYFGPTFLRGMIYVLCVAIFITVFELCFYIINIVPLEHKHIKEKIHEAKNIDIDQLARNIENETKIKIKNIIKNELNLINGKNIEEIKQKIKNELNLIDDKNINKIKKRIGDELNLIDDKNIKNIKNIEEIKKKIEDELNSLDGISVISNITESVDLKNMTLSNRAHLESFIHTISDRELKLNYKINNNATFFIVLEIFIFILFIAMLYQKLITYVTTDKRLNIGYNTYYGAGVLPPVINAFLTTLVLAIFQINMYFFAFKWVYPSDYEIDYEITKNLSEYLN